MKKEVSQILNDFLSNPEGHFTYIYDQNGTQVLRHGEIRDFLVKLSNRSKQESDFQKELLCNIPKKIENVSRIVYNQEYLSYDGKKTLEIITNLPGSKRLSYNETEMKNVVFGIKEIFQILNNNKKEYTSNLPTLKTLFYSIVSNVKDITIKRIVEKLLNNKTFVEYIDYDNNWLVLADLVSENILIYNSNAYFIDLDPIIVGPENLQFGILMSSNLLLQKEIINNLSIQHIEEMYKIWGKNHIDSYDMLSLVIFPLLMLSLRNVDYNSIKESDSPLYAKLKKLLEFLMRNINYNQ